MITIPHSSECGVAQFWLLALLRNPDRLQPEATFTTGDNIPYYPLKNNMHFDNN